jgi:hypothetical protein
MGKGKRVSQLSGPGGVFEPAGRRRACGRVGRRPTRPASGGDSVGTTWGWCRGVGPHARGRGLTAWNGDGGKREPVGVRPPMKSCGGSPRESGFATGEWWRGTGGGRGSRRWGQFDRWRPEVAGPRQVAGVRGGEVAGEATGRNRRRAGVR